MKTKQTIEKWLNDVREMERAAWARLERIDEERKEARGRWYDLSCELERARGIWESIREDEEMQAAGAAVTLGEVKPVCNDKFKEDKAGAK